MSYFIGLIVGVIIAMGWLAIDQGKALDKCQANLPRTERCVIIWVPESTLENQK